MDDSVAPVDAAESAAPGGLSPADDLDWTWPPFGPLDEGGGQRFVTEEWAPASTVRRPLVRLGRWTLVYRRGNTPGSC
ncbi:hypothetical protein GB931_18865 [Modestobacter sp. I12A-02628]|uniref:Uncharacterized protein n=1 Tax=Goekera deserti TaxID=2497753 RepID=A0A7K3W7V6_9ACTN|nr:hypothetical protein [Goekera deserti]MPQ99940.1 hypothetical protein [Goekera deserti]NDI50099.1 hypothetical protein [Goekera deserti]NEL52424.1 hypothetical protein [Goekera deserti]